MTKHQITKLATNNKDDLKILGRGTNIPSQLIDTDTGMIGVED